MNKWKKGWNFDFNEYYAKSRNESVKKIKSLFDIYWWWFACYDGWANDSFTVRSSWSKAGNFPSYKNLQIPKKSCYPENVVVSEISASVPLQDLLNHRVNQLFQTFNEEDIAFNSKDIILFVKRGFDGTTGHTRYNRFFRLQ